MLQLVTTQRLRELLNIQERSREGLPLALYGRQESNDFFLAAIYYFAEDFEAQFWVIARNDEADFIGSFCGLEAARAAATTFIGSSAEIDWILQAFSAALDHRSRRHSRCARRAVANP